ncbi:helix-turn-helix transcriptional regulator [Dorea formicigenerans]|uniref:helix-turn-helix domain-containing protein n=1 Tax=Dorea formicigenerans TaxID=39486 RepID=UPI00156E86D2|nr:helix-turn-helix transcriptional regulator [Dorea formicigenerans]NSE47680.1 helix-turn-helix transcriptional regulator [Dorea formicigenerans]
MSRRVRFGDNIKILRSRNKMTQQDLADKLHVARQTISAWQEGIGKPDIYMLADLSVIFGVTTDYLLFGQMEITEEEERILSYLEQLDQEEAEYIRNIKKKGFYDIIDQDLQNFFPIIDIPFSRIIAIALALKEQGYKITTVYGNGFGVYFDTDVAAVKFKSDLYDVIDMYMHHEEGTAVNKAEQFQARIDVVEMQILEEVKKEMFGEGDFSFYWIDQNDVIRGIAATEEECKAQAKEQGCENIVILQD